MKKILSLLLSLIMMLGVFSGVTVNSFAAGSMNERSATIKLADVKPALKKVYNANSYVKVTWGTVKGADSYRVYRKTGTGSYEYIGSTANTYFNDKDAGAGKICRYRIKAKNASGYSEYSESIAIKHIDEPTLKSIENSAYGILIKWDKVTGAEKYNVYRKVSGGEYEYIGATTNTYYTDKTAESGTKYYYAIRGKIDDSVSSQSASLSKLYLDNPTLKTPTSTTSGIKLSWSKITGAEGYIVYRKTDSGSYTKLKTLEGVAKVSYTDNSVQDSNTYTYKVKAYYSKTYSAYSNEKKITVETPATAFTKSEIVALYRDGINNAKKNAKEVTYISNETINYNNIVEVGMLSSTAQSLISSFMGYSEKNEIVDNNALPPSDISCKLSTTYVKSATITESGSYYIVKITMNDAVNPVEGEGIGAVVNIIEEETLAASLPSNATMSDFSIAYENVSVEAKIEKSTGRVVYLTADAPAILTMDVRMGVTINDAKVGIQTIDKYEIAY